MSSKEHIRLYNQNYSKTHRDKWKVYYNENRLDRIKRAKDWALKNPERAHATRRLYMRSPKGRLNSTKSSAKTRNIEYLLTDDEAMLLLTSVCFYCGEQEQQIGIDRLNSDIGYQKDNCVSCCSMCNRMKQIYTDAEFIARCKKISQYHS